MQNFRTIIRPSFNYLLVNLISIGLLYIYIYQPPIISKSIYLGIEIFIFLIFQCLYKFKPLNYFYNNFKVEINTLIIIICYAVFRDLIGGEIVYSDRMIYFTFQTFFFSNFIIWQFQKKNINIKGILLATGILASIITISMMVIPEINLVLSDYMKDELSNYENFEIRYRGYGLSENITFTYSYVLGICASICLIKIKKSGLYSLPFLTCLIGVAFNARIGFIPIIVTLCYLIFIKKDILSIGKVLFGVILTSICIYFIFQEQIEIYKATSWEWISTFFFQISNFLFGTSLQTQGDTIGTLTSSFLIFPEGIFEWIFGSGKSLFLEAGHNTDIGYLLQLNYGGIIFLSIICFFIIYTSARYWRINKFTWFAIIYSISIVALNFKGFFFAGTPGARFIYLLYTWGILETKLRKDYIKKSTLNDYL